MNSIFNHDKNTGLNLFCLELKISLTSAHQYVIFLRCDKFPQCYIPSLCLIPLQCYIASLLNPITVLYYSTIASFYHIWLSERAKYETVIHCSVKEMLYEMRC